MDAQAFRLRVLRLAAAHDVDSAVVCEALADILAVIAATLDLQDGALACDLDTRLDAIVASWI